MTEDAKIGAQSGAKRPGCAPEVGVAQSASRQSGFWVKVWMEYGRGHSTTIEDYKYLLVEDGYEHSDEEMLKEFAHDWAQYDKDGRDYEYYRYGYEVVDKPPVEWLKKELKKLEDCKKEIGERILFITEEMSGLDGVGEIDKKA